jgi:hypothetical protein
MYTKPHSPGCPVDPAIKQEFVNAHCAKVAAKTGAESGSILTEQTTRMAKHDMGRSDMGQDSVLYSGLHDRTIRRHTAAKRLARFGATYGMSKNADEMDNLRKVPDLIALEEGNQGDLDQWISSSGKGKRGPKNSKQKKEKTRFFAATVSETLREEIEAGKFEEVFGDATFECNKRFQFVNIMSKRQGDEKPVILFSILMSGRRTRDYKRVWAAIKKAFPAFDPTVFSADFERALRRSFQSVFPKAKFVGCVFHFMQSIEKRLRILRIKGQLKKRVKDALREAIMAPTVRMFQHQLASFLSMIGGGQDLPGSPLMCASLVSFGLFFVRNYVGAAGKAARVASTEEWSAHARPLIYGGTDMPLTNNPLETVHKTLKEAAIKQRAAKASPSQFMVISSEITFARVNLPALYSSARANAGQYRLPQSHRKSATSLTAIAIKSRRALLDATIANATSATSACPALPVGVTALAVVAGPAVMASPAVVTSPAVKASPAVVTSPAGVTAPTVVANPADLAGPAVVTSPTAGAGPAAVNMAPAAVAAMEVLGAVIGSGFASLGDSSFEFSYGDDNGDCLFSNLTSGHHSGPELRTLCASALKCIPIFEKHKKGMATCLQRHIDVRAASAGDSTEDWMRLNGWDGVDVWSLRDQESTIAHPAAELFHAIFSSRDGFPDESFILLLSELLPVPICVLQIVEDGSGLRCHYAQVYAGGDVDVIYAGEKTPPPDGAAVIAQFKNHFWRIIPRKLGDIDSAMRALSEAGRVRSAAPTQRALRKRKASNWNAHAFDDSEHSHSERGGVGSSKQDFESAASDAPPAADTHQQLPPKKPRGSGRVSEPTLFDHISSLLVANPASNIAEIGVGPYPGSLANDLNRTGNSILWVRLQDGHVHTTACNLDTIYERTVSSETTTAVFDDNAGVWQVALARRDEMSLLRNSDAVFESVTAALAAEQHSFAYDRCVSYDAETGFMYVVEGNERLNTRITGYSHFEVEGCCTTRNGTDTELLFVLQPSGMQPVRATNRGLPVTKDNDDLVVVAALLDLRRACAICHQNDIVVCLSRVPCLRDIGMHVIVA